MKRFVDDLREYGNGGETPLSRNVARDAADHIEKLRALVFEAHTWADEWEPAALFSGDPNWMHRAEAMLADAEHPAPQDYKVLGSLYEHECRYGCDSKWAVNCNCQGKCQKHPQTNTPITDESERD